MTEPTNLDQPDWWAATIQTVTHIFSVHLEDTPAIYAPYGRTLFFPREGAVKVILKEGVLTTTEIALRGPVRKANGLPGQRWITDSKFWLNDKGTWSYDEKADTAFLDQLAAWAATRATEMVR